MSSQVADTYHNPVRLVKTDVKKKNPMQIESE